MRIFSILTALAVAAVLYALVFERDELLALAGLNDTATAAETSEIPSETDANAGTPPSEAVRVIATKSRIEDVPGRVILRGETEPARQVDVLSETSGRVISDPLRKGTFVNAGDLLCELDPGTRPQSLDEAQAALAEARARVPEVEARIPEAEARVAEAEAALEEARINSNAASRLNEGGFASETRVAATTAGVRAAEAAVSSAQAGLQAARSGIDSASAGIQSAAAAVARIERDIDNLSVTAPFDGLLESDTAELGALLQAGSRCATILQLDPIKVVGFAPETEIARIEVGARAGARLTGGEMISGRVTFVSRNADPATRTFRVEITVPNGALAVSAGQTAEIAVTAESQAAHLIPQSALTLADSGALGVRIISEDRTALFVPVEVMRDTADGIYVTGLPEEADVITVGQEYVTDGVPVIPSFEEVVP